MTALVRCLHPGMRFEGELGAPWFCRCGVWERPAVHCAAMALALLGRLSDPVGARGCTDGPHAVFWDRAWPQLLHGLTASELVAFLWELNLGVRPVEAAFARGDLLSLCGRALGRGWPVLLTAGRGHTVLVVGVESMQQGRRRDPQALLLLDPAGAPPILSGWNARLEGALVIEGACAFDGAVVVRG